MFSVGLMVICTMSTFVTGTDYLVSVYSSSNVDVTSDGADVTSDGAGGSVKISYPNRNVHQGYGFRFSRSDIRLEEKIATNLGYDQSCVLISCSHSKLKVTVYSDSYNYNVFFPLPVTALGTRYVVSSCIQNDFEYSVLVMTAYKLNVDVAIRFSTNVEFSYGSQKYGKGDTFRFSLRAYQTFTFRVRHDLSGTRINSTETIAVFSGTANSTSVYTYTQLLPVEQFSDEFVVTVNDGLPLIQFQIISEDNGFEIRFNNGTLVLANSSILNRILEKNETFHFVSSKPVMATLCRSVGNRKGFAIVPPVSSYQNHDRVTLIHTSLIVTLNTLYMEIPSYVIGGWEYIYHSKFKVGRFWWKYTRHFTAAGQSKFSSIAFTFRPQTFYIDGLSLAKDEQPIKDPINNFILVSPMTLYAYVVMVAVGDQEAHFQVRCSGNDGVKTRITYPYVEEYFYIPSHSACILETDYEHLNVFMKDLGRNRVLPLALIPVTSLGTEYVIPSYDVSLISNGRILLATGNWTASINVTIKDGVVAPYDLVEYQTVIVDYEASGMKVSASREIAVFFEKMYENDQKFMYVQLIPSEDFGNEYVLAVGSITINKFIDIHNFTEEYYINITCLDINTTLIFNDRVTVTTGETKSYHRDVSVNESLHFTSSKPVMSYLCLKIGLYRNDDVYQENSCTILPPVERYDDSAVIIINEKADLKIMTKNNHDDFQAFTVNYRLQKITLTVRWENIPNTDFKVATVTFSKGLIFLKSTHLFSIIVYGYMDHSQPQSYKVFSMYASSPNVQQRSQRLSTKAGYLTTEYTPRTTSDFSSVFTTHDGGLNSDGNVVIGGAVENGVTILIVGCLCGFIILVLVCIVGFLVIRMKRSADSKLKADTRNHHSEQPTTFEMDFVTTDRGHDMGAEAITLESKVVNPYENVGCTGQNKDNAFEKSNSANGNTYSDLTLNGEAEDDYDVIDHGRQDNDHVNM